MSCIQILLKKGHYRTTEKFIDLLFRSNIKFTSVLKNSINNIKKILQKFDDKLNLKEFIVVSPAILWAQSMDHIFIKIKFSHRHDAPGCIELTNEKLNMTHNYLSFDATCKQIDFPMKFNLELNFFDEVDEKAFTSEKSSVGRLIFTIKKKEKKYWKSLVKYGLPPNAMIWYEMRNKFWTQLRKYYDEEDAEVILLIIERMK